MTGAGGISSRELDRFVRERQSLKRNYCGVFAIDELVKDFTNCAQKVYDKSTQKLPFAIANTDPITKGGTHWFSLIKLQDSNSFFMFDSFGLMGLSSFILSDDTDLLSAFMRNLKSDTYEDQINLYSFDFSPNEYLALSSDKLAQLSETCRGLLNFFSSFAVALNMDKIKVHGVHSQLQLTETSTCGVFQLFVLDKTYEEVHETICKLHKSCTIDTIRNILDLYFVAGSTNKRLLNEHLISNYMREKDIGGEF